MSMNNPLAAVLSRMQNAERIGQRELTTHCNSKIIKSVLEIIKAEGFIGGFDEIQDKKGNALVIKLSGNLNKAGVITPNFTVKNDQYEMFEKRYLIAKDFGVLIVSTSQGIMTHKQAKEAKVGGKLLAYAY